MEGSAALLCTMFHIVTDSHYLGRRNENPTAITRRRCCFRVIVLGIPEVGTWVSLGALAAGFRFIIHRPQAANAARERTNIVIIGRI